MGDQFCAVFARPEAAVAAIFAVQRALGKEDFSAVDGLKVRAAIHTGTADERNGDYFGPAVNRVARLLAIGHGGQVLVSGVSADLVQGELPSQASLRDLGEHRLKDLARPEYVYQLLAPDLTAEFPPLRSLDSLPNNLPRMLTSFVGRDAEVAEITALVENNPLVTLVGSGGVGKTRTSLQVAANMLDGSGDGVWFVELAPLSSGDYIPSTVAQALGIKLEQEGDPVENLAIALKSKQMLLIFDNCEHLVEAAARVVGEILHRCPKIKVLASSRQGLGLRGEETYRMPSLEVPLEEAAGHLVAGEAMRSAAVALFVERALSADKKFKLTDESAPIVVDICRRLDGIPLAIELAASRVKMLSPRQLRDRLDERFRVLTGGNRDELPRQQTLRAMIDWSHDLLDDRERILFRRLGIFVNGFSLEGAVAAGSGEDLDELDVFDVLASLVDKSLVLAETDGDSLRYRLLESTRAYALEKLSDAGERDAIAGRHLTYLRDRFVELWKQTERTARTGDMTRALVADLDDVRAALDGALVRGDIVKGGEMLVATEHAMCRLGLYEENAARCEAFLFKLGGDEPLLRARLCMALAFSLDGLNRMNEAGEAATQALDLARTSGDGLAIAQALEGYSVAVSRLGRLEDALRALAEAEAIPGASPWLRLRLLARRGYLALRVGDHENSANIHERLRKEHHALGNTEDAIVSSLNLAESEHARGRTDRAIAIAREVLPSVRGVDGALLRSNLAGYLVSVGDLAGTVEAGRATVAACEADPENAYVAMALEHVALALALGGDPARAATLEGYSAAKFARLGFLREGTETRTFDRLTALLREGLSAEEIERLMAAGAALEPSAAIELAFEET